MVRYCSFSDRSFLIESGKVCSPLCIIILLPPGIQELQVTNSPDRYPASNLHSTPDYIGEIRDFESALVQLLEYCGLPSTNIFVGVEERQVVFSNARRVIERISPQQRQQSVYFSKFMAAVGSGLFDAALNYLWDETIATAQEGRAI